MRGYVRGRYCMTKMEFNASLELLTMEKKGGTIKKIIGFGFHRPRGPSTSPVSLVEGPYP